MAETMAGVNQVAEEDGQDEQPAPVMPHKEYTPQALDRAYPPLSVPDDDDHDFDDATGRDPILKEGERIAKEIAEDARVHGRKKRTGGLGGGGGGRGSRRSREGPAVDGPIAEQPLVARMACGLTS